MSKRYQFPWWIAVISLGLTSSTVGFAYEIKKGGQIQLELAKRSADKMKQERLAREAAEKAKQEAEEARDSALIRLKEENEKLKAEVAKQERLLTDPEIRIPSDFVRPSSAQVPAMLAVSASLFSLEDALNAELDIEIVNKSKFRKSAVVKLAVPSKCKDKVLADHIWLSTPARSDVAVIKIEKSEDFKNCLASLSASEKNDITTVTFNEINFPDRNLKIAIADESQLTDLSINSKAQDELTLKLEQLEACTKNPESLEDVITGEGLLAELKRAGVFSHERLAEKRIEKDLKNQRTEFEKAMALELHDEAEAATTKEEIRDIKERVKSFGREHPGPAANEVALIIKDLNAKELELAYQSGNQALIQSTKARINGDLRSALKLKGITPTTKADLYNFSDYIEVDSVYRLSHGGLQNYRQYNYAQFMLGRRLNAEYVQSGCNTQHASGLSTTSSLNTNPIQIGFASAVDANQYRCSYLTQATNDLTQINQYNQGLVRNQTIEAARAQQEALKERLEATQRQAASLQNNRGNKNNQNLQGLNTVPLQRPQITMPQSNLVFPNSNPMIGISGGLQTVI